MAIGASVLGDVRSRYPCLEGLGDALVSERALREMQQIDAPAGALLFEQERACRGFPLVLDGEVAVSRNNADSGRSVELYRVYPGEICVISGSGLLARAPLLAQGAAVTPTRLILVPPDLFLEWTAHLPFRQFVFGVYAERLADLMALIDAIAFQRLDRRLADHLLGHGQVYRTTHQALADELGTVRRIITRLLSRFEADGLVRLGRERIEVLDVQGLRSVAGGQHAGL